MNPAGCEAEHDSIWKRLQEAELRERRRRFRATTPGERLEQAFELSELSRELRVGLCATAQMSERPFAASEG